MQFHVATLIPVASANIYKLLLVVHSCSFVAIMQESYKLYEFDIWVFTSSSSTGYLHADKVA